MDAKQRKLVIIGAILLSALIVGTATVLVLRSQRGDSLCTPSSELVRFDPNGMKYVASADNRVLVGLFAYLMFEDHGHRKYSPLSQMGSVKSDLDDRNRQILTMNDTCTKLIFKFDQTGQANHIKSFRVGPTERGAVKACGTKDTGIYFGENEGYSCFSSMRLPCYELRKSLHESGEDELSNKRVADLVIEALRFEINGEPKQIATGKFSKPAHYCF